MDENHLGRPGVRARAVGIVGLLGVLICLSGCSGRGTVSTPSLPTASPIMLYNRSGRTTASFASPSHNVTCGFAAASSAETSGTVRCMIIVKKWRPPVKPQSCTANWGLGVILGSQAAMLCASDSIQIDSTSAVLPVGTSMRFSPFTCVSRATGVDCENTTTGAGFLITQERYELRNP